MHLNTSCGLESLATEIGAKSCAIVAFIIIDGALQNFLMEGQAPDTRQTSAHFELTLI